ncbi:MAG TPA: hypothetical protein DD727_03675 [Clostridiales bacterium]|nr:hypothetical protein [Clostridiales bacterium]
MKQKERFIRALERKPLPGRVPHFELVFFLTMEAFGKLHPYHRHYHQWDQMLKKERHLHRNDIADVHIETARRFEHSAIIIHSNPPRLEETIQISEIIREKTGDEYFLMTEGDGTFPIPNGNTMLDFASRMADDPEGLHREADKKITGMLARIETLVRAKAIDGVAMNADYCFNNGPFLSPSMFSEFITPYLARQIQGYRDMGLYSIKHSDGNIMPILDQLLEAGPDALHSLDPQVGVDIAEVKRRVGHRVCLIGNVNCGLLQTLTDEEAAESVRYCLRHGMPGDGYIFSTSNCIYTGLHLERYEQILEIWRKEGNADV